MTSPAQTPLRMIEEAALRTGLDARALGRRIGELSASAPDPERALRNLHRIVETSFSTSLLRDFAAHPVLLDVTFELVGQSQYLADIIVRDPELLRWLTASDVLTRARSAADLETEARGTMELFERPERRLDALRRFHRREMLRIGAREILQEGDVETVTAELSALADVVVRCVTDQALAELNSRLGFELSNHMAVIALGKLGGGELNFSSDIDLMFVYDEDGDLPRKAGRIHTWHEFHIRLGEAIVRGLTEFSSEGHMYRVDMRLRPDGRSGPLAMSRAAMMTYYESRGAAWERQMLLKARVIAGAIEVGEQFLKDLHPFVFPRTATQAPWREIGNMKESIEREADVEGNIKLGAGGIRDIEFLVQGLQLLFAGQDLSLRTGHTLRALDRLVASGHIPPDDGRRLRDAYMFFRTVEHRLQLLHGQQTHQLPESEAEQTILGRKLGKGNAKSFLEEVKSRRAFVRAHFEAFTRRPSAAGEAPALQSDSVVVALDSTNWPEGVRSTVAERLRSMLAEDASRRLLETALRHGRHRAWILKTVLLAPRIAERFTREPLLLESLVGNADTLLRSSELGWSEFRQTDLRRFHHYNEARTAIRLMLGAATSEAIEKELSTLALQVLTMVVERAGIPSQGLAVLGLGKLGGGEMGFGSDLDLVVVFDERRCDRATAEGAGRAIAQGVAATPPLYKVDFRLRPEGGNAPLAVERGYFASYFAERAEPWEFMALTRTRLVWGDAGLGRVVMRVLRTVLSRRGPVPAAYVLKMRRAMETQRVQRGSTDLKLSAGGTVDIEFVAQSLALSHHSLIGRSTASVLALARRRRWLSAQFARPLLEGLNELRALEATIRLGSPAASSVLPDSDAALSALAAGLGMSEGRDLIRRVRTVMKQNRAAFRAFMARQRATGRRRP